MIETTKIPNERKILWEEFYNLSHRLVSQINENKYRPDFIFGIVRGGLVPASLLAYFFPDSSLLSLAVIKEGETRRVDKEIVDQLDLTGKRVLIVEDMLETGRSAMTAKEFLENKGALVKIACYFTSLISEIKPDFVIEEKIVGKIIFPWE